MNSLNEEIISQPIAFLLGAGSSVPLGMPTTLGFRKTLFQNVAKNELTAISDLYDMAATRYHIGPEHVNLEEFLEYLNELRLALWILWRSDFRQSISEPIASLGFDAFRAAESPVNLARIRTLRVLHEVCGDCDAGKASGLWTPIFENLAQFSNIFPIFTFNYDWVFEKIAITFPERYKLADGFSSALGGYWAEKWFADFKPSPQHTNICLFKLHGSTCWIGHGQLVKSLGSFAQPEEETTYSFEDYQSPFEIIYPGYRRQVYLGDEHWSMTGLDDSVILPGTPEGEPYSLLNQYLQSWMSKGKILVVIGYAFGDGKMNAYISNALQQNKDLHVVVLDPGTDVLWVESPFEHRLDIPGAIESRVIWVRGRLGNKRDTHKLLNRVRQLATTLN